MGFDLKIIQDRKVSEEDRKILALCNVSERIRYLDEKGYTRSEIHTMLHLIPQHVHNILNNPVKNKFGTLMKKQSSKDLPDLSDL